MDTFLRRNTRIALIAVLFVTMVLLAYSGQFDELMNLFRLTPSNQDEIASSSYPDPVHFKFTGGESTPYTLRNGQIFSEENLVYADARTFRVIARYRYPDGDDFFGADENSVFFYHWKLPQADPHSWRLSGKIEECPSTPDLLVHHDLGNGCFYQSRDDLHFYFQDNLVAEYILPE